jgi:hypothetical protein
MVINKLSHLHQTRSLHYSFGIRIMLHQKCMVNYGIVENFKAI